MILFPKRKIRLWIVIVGLILIVIWTLSHWYKTKQTQSKRPDPILHTMGSFLGEWIEWTNDDKDEPNDETNDEPMHTEKIHAFGTILRVDIDHQQVQIQWEYVHHQQKTFGASTADLGDPLIERPSRRFPFLPIVLPFEKVHFLRSNLTLDNLRLPFL